MASPVTDPLILTPSVSTTSVESYGYSHLPSDTAFRVAELLPGQEGDPISCTLHVVEWDEDPQYEAISYAWGDRSVSVPILADGKIVEITRSLHAAFTHFRSREHSRILWADALCINQHDIKERGLQVKQMKRIYENAQKVQVWLGPDNERHQAEVAVQSIQIISDFLCDTLGIDIATHDTQTETYQELLLKNRDKLPLPDETEFSSDGLWSSLVWFYSHRYFTRVWIIQEVCANTKREVNIGYSKTIWSRLDLTASYIIMEPAFSNKYGFGDAYCWFVATVAELSMHPKRWLNTLYLASNYGCVDARDVIYGLRGLMSLAEGEGLLEPDYSKRTEEVYRDSVEAALINFKRTDILLYVTGREEPSWVPRWDVPMLFRNPFRFGKPMPWKPANETRAAWSVDRSANVLTLCGYDVGTIEFAESYNQVWFANGTIDSSDGKAKLQKYWAQILHTLGESQKSLPLSASFLDAVATSLSFGLNHKLNTHEHFDLTREFASYLVLVLDDDVETIQKYIPRDLLEDSKEFNGRNFGKPVWDFQYPEASLFVTKGGFVGCAIATTQVNDVVFIALGSTYPMVLRPVKVEGHPQRFTIRGFSYVHGMMSGEQGDSKISALDIC